MLRINKFKKWQRNDNKWRNEKLVVDVVIKSDRVIIVKVKIMLRNLKSIFNKQYRYIIIV